jgi:hypothetical protein
MPLRARHLRLRRRGCVQHRRCAGGGETLHKHRPERALNQLFSHTFHAWVVPTQGAALGRLGWGSQSLQGVVAGVIHGAAVRSRVLGRRSARRVRVMAETPGLVDGHGTETLRFMMGDSEVRHPIHTPPTQESPHQR